MKENSPNREMVGFEVLDDDYYIRSKQCGGSGEAVFIDFKKEEIGRVSTGFQAVLFLREGVSNGYILEKKDALKICDEIKIHGHVCIITEKKLAELRRHC